MTSRALRRFLLAEWLPHGFDGALLIVASGDFPVDLDVFQAGRMERRLKASQGRAWVDRRDLLALRVSPVVYAGVEAVGEEDDRAAAALFSRMSAYSFGLRAALGRVCAGAFGPL